MSFTDNTER